MDREEAYWTKEEQGLFERYLMDQMEPGEKAGFESSIISNPTLNAKFLEFKALFRAIEEAGLRHAMEDFHKGVQKDGKERRLVKTSRAVFRMAATIALLMALGGVWYFYTPNANERLFEAYYVPDPGLPTVMGNSDNYDFYRAMVAYKQGDYPFAIEAWEKLRSKGVANDTLDYFLGSAHLANDQPDKGIEYFEGILDKENPAFTDEAFFYLGLAYLKKDEAQQARKYLKESDLEKAKVLVEKIKD
ncbi:tetratricopeptide repeat protein [Flagellimonas oceanensis]|uniref:tetratricopeptide repeat protein n=1 Tax=Flagellimonas oceanensis TaxID=2499163 RepID=UPI000F8D4F92|nr:tetratricopeptide repeat protein [Allomuricauda oceanensis]